MFNKKNIVLCLCVFISMPFVVFSDKARGGEIVYIDEGMIYFDAGEENGVKIGDRFQITRPGKEIVHPKTGEVIGTTEKVLFQIETVIVREKLSAGERVDGEDISAAKVGDRVSPVSITPVITSEIKNTPSIIRKETVQPDDITFEIEKFEVVDMASGDLDGDGVSEIIVTNSSEIRIYRLQGEGGNFIQVATYKPGFRQKIVDLSAGDIDGDGKAELAVVSYPGRYIKGFVYRLAGNTLKPAGEFYNQLVKILKINNRTSILLSQDFTGTMLFTGKVTEGVFTAGKWDFKIGRKWKKINIFGLGLVDIDNDNKKDVLYVNPEGYMERFNRNERIWQGASPYGGSRIKFKSQRSDREIMKNDALLAYEHEGKPYVFVIENQKSRGKLFNLFSLKVANPYKSGMVHSLKWEKGAMTRLWSTRTLSGYLPSVDVFYYGSDAPPRLVVPVITGTGKKSHARFHFIPVSSN